MPVGEILLSDFLPAGRSGIPTVATVLFRQFGGIHRAFLLGPKYSIVGFIFLTLIFITQIFLNFLTQFLNLFNTNFYNTNFFVFLNTIFKPF